MSATLNVYRLVSKLTLGYLLLPCILWTALWLKPLWTAVFIILLVGSGAIVWRQMGQIQLEENEDPLLNWKRYLAIVAPFLLLSCIAGIGGIGPQETDWYKHNSIIYDLSTRQWPVIYDDWKGDFGVTRPYLSFYLAYYLPATFISKLFADSFAAASWLLLLWTQIGLCLAAFWLMMLVRSPKWWLGLAFCLTGNIQGWVLSLFDVLHISRHVLRMQFDMPNVAGVLFWAPHHAIAACLGIPFLLAHLLRRQWSFPQPTRIFWWVILFSWSPFVAGGALVWLIFTQFNRRATFVTSLRDSRFLCLSAMAWLGIQGLYFGQRIPIVRLPEHFPEYSFLPLEYARFMGEWRVGLANFFFRYGILVVMMWAIPAYFLWKWNQSQNRERLLDGHKNDLFIFQNAKQIILIACGTVFFLGLFRGGIANDSFWRGVLTPFIALFSLSFWLWHHAQTPKYFRTIFLICFLLLLVRPIRSIGKRVNLMVTDHRLIYRPASTNEISFVNSKIQVNVRRQQYLGLPDSIFARYFLRDNQKE